MANPYIGSKITGCNSPALGNDRNTYSGTIDQLAQVLDLHDHTTGKGNPITTASLADGSVTNPKLGALSVDSTKIADGSVITAKIPDGAVATAKLADSGVTTVKLADGSVTYVKLAASNTAITASTTSTYSIASGTSVPVVPLSQALTVSSATSYVRIRLLPDAAATGALIASTQGFTLELWRDTGAGAVKIQGMSVAANQNLIPSAVSFEDTSPVAVASTYSIRITGTATTSIFSVRMRVTEKK